jgi:hypothetical protein
MHRYLKVAVASLVPVALSVGCNDWLTGTGLTTNPNRPVVAGVSQLFEGVTVTQTVQQTGDLARLFSMWMQSMAGTDRQAIPLANYSFDEDAFSGDWSNVYAGGGLIDLRNIQTQSLAVGDTAYVGVAKVMEALTMGTAADVWGDIPYREAVGSSLTPHLDPQQQVFSDIQAQLDTAIVYMQCHTGTCAGPGPNDLFYGGDLSKWTALAHTLKARYFLHVSTQDPSAFASAVAEAQQGITDTTGDLTSYQSTTPTEQNLWYQFMQIQRQGYISAGATLLNMLVGHPVPFVIGTRANGVKDTTFVAQPVDPRAFVYYSLIDSVKASDSSHIYFFRGAPPAGGNGTWSSLAPFRAGLAVGAGFRQPIVTSAENELILAEAELQTGHQPEAIAAYNAERASQGMPAWAGGAITLNDIITEKYIADFQQIEVWNDWKRTCLPALVPAVSSGIPGRLLYGLSAERDANPNIPPPDQQPARNWDQPNACPIL